MDKRRQSNQRQERPYLKAAPPASDAPPPTVTGRWLLSALGIVFAAGALFTYLILAVLFYAGQWQLVLHPANTITATPSAKFDEIHFDYTETGDARLDGWWIPASPGSRWSDATVLYLHGANGSLSNYVADLNALHALGINVFAFDYRGYGRSAGPHPTESRMNADADAAWNYLTGTRQLNPGKIVVYGSGYGASIAADLASRHAPAGVVLDAPNEPARNVIASNPRAKQLPMWLLLNEHFDSTAILKTLATPKLFLDRNGEQPRTRQLFNLAASPKELFELKGGAGYQAATDRFLDTALK